MAAIVECVPNFSEGENLVAIEALADEARRVPGIILADYSADKDHGRSVFTLMGSPDNMETALLAMCRRAAERINITRHTGIHPRMGAVDVIPFIPLRGISMPECAALAHRVAQRIWRELQIPCYMYEEAATLPQRKNLADVRRGGFEALSAKMLRPEWAPDYGERRPHPTAGAVAVGARKPLVAFNVNLATADVAVAKEIAKVIRASSGGYPACKALGVFLPEKGMAQVTMNLVDYEETPIHQVFDAICREAAERGVEIEGSELIGLAPAKALLDCVAHYLKLKSLDYTRQVIESYLPQGE